MQKTCFEKEKQNRVIASIRDCLIKLLQEEWDVLFLVTRKGYWSYKTLTDDVTWKVLREENPEVMSKIESGEKIIRTDRYLIKCVNVKEEFGGKKVFIYDDTMTRGTNLFFYFSYLTSHNIDVTPVVYALSTTYPSDETKDNLVTEFQRLTRNGEPRNSSGNDYVRRFNAKLLWYRRLTPGNLSEICIWETNLFNENLCPLVIDLPILSRMKTEQGYTEPAYMNNGMGAGITLTEEQFQKLTTSQSEWKFIVNQFSDSYIDYCSSYFENRENDTGNLKNLVLNLIVKCKYKKENGKVKVVFVPFAVYRSMGFSDVVKTFFVLWGDTSYGEEMLKTIQKEIAKRYQVFLVLSKDKIDQNALVLKLLGDNHNLSRNLFRSIIFYLSAYIGAEFKKYVWRLTNLELEYDFDFMKESLSEDFVESFKEMIGKGNEQKKYFLNAPCADPVSSTGLTKIENKPRKIASKESIEKSIRERVINKKNSDTHKLFERVYVIETMEDDLEREYVFQDKKERESLLTEVIVDMLENSRLGNEIFVDNEKQIVYRGFRTGENSELLFYSGIVYFYTYIYFYYLLSGAENYCRNYWSFVDRLDLYLRSKQYVGSLISEEELSFYKSYFEKLKSSRLDEQIRNKRYLLDNYWNPHDESGIRAYIYEAYNNVQVWMVEEE